MSIHFEWETISQFQFDCSCCLFGNGDNVIEDIEPIHITGSCSSRYERDNRLEGSYKFRIKQNRGNNRRSKQMQMVSISSQSIMLPCLLIVKWYAYRFSVVIWYVNRTAPTRYANAQYYCNPYFRFITYKSDTIGSAVSNQMSNLFSIEQ